MEPLHSLLKRQLKRSFGDSFAIPEEWQGFIRVVDDAYREFDTDRGMLERSLELSSQELLQSNSEMRAIFQSIPDLFFLFDRQGVILDYKAGNTSDLFLLPGELIGKHIQDVPLRPAGDKFHEAIAQAQKTRSIISFEYSLVIQDQTNYYEARLVPCFDDQIIAIIRNITERKQADDALRESEQRLSEIIDFLPDATFAIDREGKVIAWNRAIEEMTGIKAEAVLGQGDYAYALPFYGIRRPILIDLVFKSDKEIGEYYHSVKKEGDVVMAELDLPIRGGEKCTLWVKAVPLYDSKRNVVGAIEAIRDITERRQAEEGLRRAKVELEDRVAERTAALQTELAERQQVEEALGASEYLYHSLVEALPINVCRKDLKGRFTFGNKRFCTSLQRPLVDIVGKTDFDIHPPALAEKYRQDDRRVVETGETWETIEEHALLGSEKSYVQVIKTSLYDTGGKVAGVQIIFWDVTERIRAEEQMRERTMQLEISNKELADFSYVVSHDLRSPLRAIDGFSQALLEDYADRLDDQAKDYLYRVRRASQRMGDLTDCMRRLASITRSKMRREPVELSVLAQTIATELWKSQPQRRVEFIIAPSLMVNADPNLMCIVLENLMQNAWKFTGTHSTATIEVGTIECEGQTAYFVRDDGVGFDMAYADKLFGAFQRIHAPAEFEGIGFGLAIVERIIQRHGGRIWAEGAVEQGATFYFTLSG